MFLLLLIMLIAMAATILQYHLFLKNNSRYFRRKNIIAVTSTSRGAEDTKNVSNVEEVNAKYQTLQNELQKAQEDLTSAQKEVQESKEKIEALEQEMKEKIKNLQEEMKQKVQVTRQKKNNATITNHIAKNQSVLIINNDGHTMCNSILNLEKYQPRKTIGYKTSNRCQGKGGNPIECEKVQIEIKSPPPLADHTKIETSIHKAGCLFFQCEKNATLCDNNNPTEYNGSKPPCCVHILRDVAHEFDSEMCRIGVDYIATFGTLLGLIRSDRLIPWTGDMDYIIPSKAAANAMVHLWDTKKTGLRHVFQGINRMCITSDFANGELAKWNISAPDPKRKISGQICGDNGNTLWDCGFPYVDFYVGRDHPVYKG